MTQVKCSIPPSSATMRGIAVDTIVWSNAAIKRPNMTPVIVRIRRLLYEFWILNIFIIFIQILIYNHTMISLQLDVV